MEEEPNHYTGVILETQPAGNLDWDDSELIKAYDEAVLEAKVKIMRKLKKELNLDQGDIEFIMGKNFSLDKYDKEANKRDMIKNNKQSSSVWKVGDPCRCRYSENNVEYEAEIISIIEDIGCRVKYIGYENEEVVSVHELNPSLGEEAIRVQKEEAEFYEVLDEEEEIDPKCEPKEEMLHHLNFPKSFSFASREMFSNPINAPPVPPIPPFSLFSNSNRKGAYFEGKDLDSLLMSWFMCGYHTGYCAGQQI